MPASSLGQYQITECSAVGRIAGVDNSMPALLRNRIFSRVLSYKAACGSPIAGSCRVA